MDGFAIATALLRGTHAAASMSLFGGLVFQCFVVPADATGPPARPVDRSARMADRIIWASAGLALLSGMAWLAAVSATIAGAGGVQTLARALQAVALGTVFGRAESVRLILLAVVAALLVRRSRPMRLATLLIAGLALVPQPLLGHAGASEARSVLIPIEIAHVLAAAAWLGCLLPLLLYVLQAPVPLAARCCERFTPVGLVAVGTIALSALPQAGAFIGGIGGLFGTPYGQLTLLKCALFLVALALAAANRLLFTARLGAPIGRRMLAASIAVETVAVLCAVLTAGFLASSVPAAHAQPVWPFAWRPSFDALSDPSERPRLLWLLLALACASALFAASILRRRFRVLAVALAVLLVAPFTPALSLLLVPAWPTSYAQSPTEFSVHAIVRGETLFGQVCAPCHTPREGTGGPDDLTAPHIWGHLDGELYWRIAHGVAGADGAAVMPGFATALRENDIWAVIDAIRARNIGWQTEGGGHWTPPIPAPATPLVCADRDVDSLPDLAPAVLIVVADGDSKTAPVPDTPGTVTIHLPRAGSSSPSGKGCTAASRDAWEAWRLLSGEPPESFAGSRAVVDGQGWLRAWQPPAGGSDALAAAVRDARDHPIAFAPALAAHHH